MYPDYPTSPPYNFAPDLLYKLYSVSKSHDDLFGSPNYFHSGINTGSACQRASADLIDSTLYVMWFQPQSVSATLRHWLSYIKLLDDIRFYPWISVSSPSIYHGSQPRTVDMDFPGVQFGAASTFQKIC